MRITISRCLIVALLGLSTTMNVGCRSTGASWPSFGSWSSKKSDTAAGLAASKPSTQLPPSPSSTFSPTGNTVAAGTHSTTPGTVGPGGYPSTGMSGPSSLAQPASATGSTNGYYTGPYSTGGSAARPAGYGSYVQPGAAGATAGSPSPTRPTDGYRSADLRGAATGMTSPAGGYPAAGAAPNSSAANGGYATPGGATYGGTGGYGQPAGAPYEASPTTGAYSAPGYSRANPSPAASPAGAGAYGAQAYSTPSTSSPAGGGAYGAPAYSTPSTSSPAGGVGGRGDATAATPSSAVNDTGFRPGSTARGRPLDGGATSESDTGVQAAGYQNQPSSGAGTESPPADTSGGRFVPPGQ